MSRELAYIALNILMRLHKEYGRVVGTGPLAYLLHGRQNPRKKRKCLWKSA